MINIVICDDEEIFNDKIYSLISTNIDSSYKYEIKKYTNALELINALNRKIDILFMDIELGCDSGIEIVKKIKSLYQDCIVFFVTSHNNYITEVFRLDSFQFISKPIDEKEFIIDLKRGLEKYKKSHRVLEIEYKNSYRISILVKFITLNLVLEKHIFI